MAREKKPLRTLPTPIIENRSQTQQQKLGIKTDTSVSLDDEPRLPNFVEEEKKERVLVTRLNQNDPTAAFIYSLGSSLVHLALFITIFMVRQPNIEEAAKAQLEFFHPQLLEQEIVGPYSEFLEFAGRLVEMSHKVMGEDHVEPSSIGSCFEAAKNY